MAIYFARASRTDFVKIGYATNPRRRIAYLQAGCPYELTIVRVIDGDKRTEAALHRVFAGRLIEREWFRWSDEMLTVEAPLIPLTGFAELIDRLGGAAAVARELGLRPGTMQQMKNRNSIPCRHWLGLIELSARRGVPDITAKSVWRMAFPEAEVSL